MMPALDTLFTPFDQGILRMPAETALFIGARAHPVLAEHPVHCIQPFFPWAQGLPDHPAVPAYPLALVLASKAREEACGQLASALASLSSGGLLAAAAANDANGSRLEKWFKQAGLEPHSLSKNKCRVVWAVKNEAAAIPDEWLAYQAPTSIEMDGHIYLTQAGLFGFDKIDAGSKLLGAYLPDTLKGNVADFGCGYGYLSVQALQKNAAIAALDLIDADSRALACAQQNGAAVSSVPLNSVWADLTAPLGKTYDAIVMNPPFHEGKLSDAAIGLGFVRTAAASLKKGGKLYMVANRQLPYEKTLAELFAKVEKKADEQGYKILFATK